MRRVLAMSLFLTFASMVAIVQAAERPNPTGIWHLSIDVSGRTYEYFLKLKLDGAKLTGTVVGDDAKEAPLQAASFKNGLLSCTVIHEEDAERIPVKSTAAISGDTMKGKATFDLNGETVSLPWEAKRMAAAKLNPVGNWKLSIDVDGNTYEFVLKLKSEGGKLTGTIAGEDGKETPVKDLKCQNGILSCSMVREEDGTKIPVKATAMIVADTMQGRAVFEMDGEPQNLPWEAKRAKK